MQPPSDDRFHGFKCQKETAIQYSGIIQSASLSIIQHKLSIRPIYQQKIYNARVRDSCILSFLLHKLDKQCTDNSKMHGNTTMQ